MKQGQKLTIRQLDDTIRHIHTPKHRRLFVILGSGQLVYQMWNVADRHPNKTGNITLNFIMPVDKLRGLAPYENETSRQLLQDILKFIIQCEAHELREQITFRGEIISNPHSHSEPRLDLMWHSYQDNEEVSI